MKTIELKNLIVIVISFLGVIFFGYIWLSKTYNDSKNYNFLNNNFGQFSFAFFLTLFLYRFMKIFNKENFFPIIIIIFLLAIFITYFAEKILLWPSMIVFLISIPLYFCRKYLKIS
jgi:hypothetical protein